MYYRFFYGSLSGSDSEDLYDSDDYDTEYEEEDSFEALCRFEAQSTPNTSCSSLDSWLIGGTGHLVKQLVSHE